MSTIIEVVNHRNFSHIVLTNSQETYYVDSTNVFDGNYETMAFIWDKEKQMVTDWTPVYQKSYMTFQEMAVHHDYIINNLEKCL